MQRFRRSRKRRFDRLECRVHNGRRYTTASLPPGDAVGLGYRCDDGPSCARLENYFECPTEICDIVSDDYGLCVATH